MNKQTRIIVFNFSALLVLLGAVLYLTQFEFSSYLFAFGAAGVAICHLALPTKDMGFRERRLQTFNVIAGLLMVVASTLMFMNRKEWVICLTVAAILQLYTAFVGGKASKTRE